MSLRRTRPASTRWLASLGVLAFAVLALPMLPQNANANPFYVLLRVDTPDAFGVPTSGPATIPLELQTLLAGSAFEPISVVMPPGDEAPSSTAMANYGMARPNTGLPSPTSIVPSLGNLDLGPVYEYGPVLEEYAGRFEPFEPPIVRIPPPRTGPVVTAPVPEPGAAMLFATGLLVGSAARRVRGRR